MVAPKSEEWNCVGLMQGGHYGSRYGTLKKNGTCDSKSLAGVYCWNDRVEPLELEGHYYNARQFT